MTENSRHSVSVATVVTNEEGYVLVIQRRDNGQWQIPGGILELGESIEDGLKREVHEETGIEVEPERLTGVYKNMNLGVVALVFRASHISGQTITAEESTAVEWWPPSSVTDTMSEAFAIRISDALRPSGEPSIRHHDGIRLL